MWRMTGWKYFSTNFVPSVSLPSYVSRVRVRQGLRKKHGIQPLVQLEVFSDFRRKSPKQKKSQAVNSQAQISSGSQIFFLAI